MIKEESEEVQKPKEGEILFRLNFELGEGRSAKLSVREGQNFYNLA